MVPVAPGSGEKDGREDALTTIWNSFFLPFSPYDLFSQDFNRKRE